MVDGGWMWGAALVPERHMLPRARAEGTCAVRIFVFGVFMREAEGVEAGRCEWSIPSFFVIRVVHGDFVFHLRAFV